MTFNFYRKKLESHLESSTLTKLLVSFSRDENQPEGSPLYVQDNVRSNGQELVKLLEEKKAIVYVCGDAKNMAKDVNEAFIDIVSKEKGTYELFNFNSINKIELLLIIMSNKIQ